MLGVVRMAPVLLWQALGISAAPVLSALNVRDTKHEEIVLTLNEY